MRNQNIDLEVADLFPVEADAHLLPTEREEDTFDKFFRDWENGIDADALHKQTAYLDAALKVAAKASAPAEVTDPQKLEKRFSQPDPRSAYREYFREQLAKGKSAAEILDAWCAEFPHRNPSIEKLMRETAEEFA
jgi:hypothetical protein